jgi:hypothetical protein
MDIQGMSWYSAEYKLPVPGVFNLSCGAQGGGRTGQLLLETCVALVHGTTCEKPRRGCFLLCPDMECPVGQVRKVTHCEFSK